MTFKGAMFSSKTELWETPQALFDELNREFDFTLDPCATPSNAKCKRFFTIEDDGLSQSWKNERVFCNPPYCRKVGRWVEKAASGEADLVVMLLFARTDTAWFHEHIYGRAEVRFLRGRLKFGTAKYNAPAPSMVVIFRRSEG